MIDEDRERSEERQRKRAKKCGKYVSGKKTETVPRLEKVKLEAY